MCSILPRATSGHLQEWLRERTRVRRAPECHKINLSRAGFHSITEKPAEAGADGEIPPYLVKY